MPQDILQLRSHLFATLADLRDREKPVDMDRVHAITEVAGVMLESAKIEVSFLKVTGALKSTDFLPDGDEEQPRAEKRLLASGIKRPA